MKEIKIYKDGNQFCCLSGENLQEGIAGFGDTIKEAMKEYAENFLHEIVYKQNARGIYSETDEKIAKQIKDTF